MTKHYLKVVKFVRLLHIFSLENTLYLKFHVDTKFWLRIFDHNIVSAHWRHNKVTLWLWFWSSFAVVHCFGFTCPGSRYLRWLFLKKNQYLYRKYGFMSGHGGGPVGVKEGVGLDETSNWVWSIKKKIYILICIWLLDPVKSLHFFGQNYL